MQWLPREEVTLLLGALAALGFLVLGVLDLLWPSGPRRSRPRKTAPGVARPAAAARTPVRMPVRVPVRAPVRPAVRTVVLRTAVTAEASHAPPVLDNAQRATHALGIGRTLLERAVRDATLSSDRRLMLLQSAIVWLTRGVQFAPNDAALVDALARAREALWTAYQDIALARLAAEMPWGTTALGAESKRITVSTG